MPCLLLPSPMCDLVRVHTHIYMRPDLNIKASHVRNASIYAPHVHRCVTVRRLPPSQPWLHSSLWQRPGVLPDPHFTALYYSPLLPRGNSPYFWLWINLQVVTQRPYRSWALVQLACSLVYISHITPTSKAITPCCSICLKRLTGKGTMSQLRR